MTESIVTFRSPSGPTIVNLSNVVCMHCQYKELIVRSTTGYTLTIYYDTAEDARADLERAMKDAE